MTQLKKFTEIRIISIIIRLNSTLKNLNAEISQMKQTKYHTFRFNTSEEI